MKNKKHSHEFKVKVVNEYLNNDRGYTYLGKKHNVNPSIIRKWVIMYEQFGYVGLTKSMTKTHYSGDFKRAVLQYRQENQLSYTETAIHFGIKNSTTIANWQRKFIEGGPTALEGNIGRPRNYMSNEKKETNKNIDPNKPLNETEREELERLREQVRMAELENIILKKLNALPKNPTDKK